MKEVLTRNIGMKILSIVVAIMFWVLINGITDPVKLVVIDNVPVKLLNEEAMLSAGKLIEITSGDKVSIKVRAKRSIAESLSVDDFEALADVTNKNEFNAVPIIVNCKSHSDSEVEIVSTATEDRTTMLHLSLEDLNSQSFAVAIITDGHVEDGYYIASSSVSPNLITITGTETQLSKVARVAVIVDVNHASKDLLQFCRVEAYDKEGNTVSSGNLTFSQNSVQVSMTLVPTKEVPLIVEESGTPANGYVCDSIEYAPHYVTIAGPAATLNGVTEIRVNCDITDATADVEAEVNISALLNDMYNGEIKLVNEGQKVYVRAKINPLVEREINILTSSIELRNFDFEEFTCEIENLTLTLTVIGRAAVVEKILASDIVAYIDCSNFTRVGNYNALVHVEKPDNVETKLLTVDLVIKKQTEKESK